MMRRINNSFVAFVNSTLDANQIKATCLDNRLKLGGGVTQSRWNKLVRRGRRETATGPIRRVVMSLNDYINDYIYQQYHIADASPETKVDLAVGVT